MKHWDNQAEIGADVIPQEINVYAVCSACGHFEFTPADSCSSCWKDTLCLTEDTVAATMMQAHGHA